jgi:hypothetical protein
MLTEISTFGWYGDQHNLLSVATFGWWVEGAPVEFTIAFAGAGHLQVTEFGAPGP